MIKQYSAIETGGKDVCLLTMKNIRYIQSKNQVEEQHFLYWLKINGVISLI